MRATNSLALLLTMLMAGAALADRPSVSVKPIGASFIEAPPGREKNLVPMGAFGSQEKVEMHAVVAVENRVIADTPTFGDDSVVNAIAVFPDKSSVVLGTASSFSVRKLSQDRRKTLVSLSISRLPDRPVSAITFKGIVKLSVAKSTREASVSFQPKVGTQVDVGLGKVTVSELGANSLTLSGDERLTQIAGLRIIKPDGSMTTAERGAYSKRTDTDKAVVSTQWQFSGPLSAGKLDVSMYDELETAEVPINITINKPY